MQWWLIRVSVSFLFLLFFTHLSLQAYVYKTDKCDVTVLSGRHVRDGTGIPGCLPTLHWLIIYSAKQTWTAVFIDWRSVRIPAQRHLTLCPVPGISCPLFVGNLHFMGSDLWFSSFEGVSLSGTTESCSSFVGLSFTVCMEMWHNCGCVLTGGTAGQARSWLRFCGWKFHGLLDVYSMTCWMFGTCSYWVNVWILVLDFFLLYVSCVTYSSWMSGSVCLTCSSWILTSAWQTYSSQMKVRFTVSNLFLLNVSFSVSDLFLLNFSFSVFDLFLLNVRFSVSDLFLQNVRFSVSDLFSWMSASTCLWVRWTAYLLAWGAGWLFFNQGPALLHSACFGETLPVSCYACPFIWRCCCQFVNVVQVYVVHMVYQLHKGAKMWIPQTLFQRSRPLSSSDLFLSFCLSLEKERKTVLLMQDDFI